MLDVIEDAYLGIEGSTKPTLMAADSQEAELGITKDLKAMFLPDELMVLAESFRIG